MIVDKLDNWKLYPYGPAWEKAFNFLGELSADIEDGEYSLYEDGIFARVMSYATLSPEAATLESHRKYIDIQTVIVGAEGIEWHLANTLSVAGDFNPATDVQLYEHPACAPARVDIFPETFVALFPNDAHMPALQVHNRSQTIKKAVVKIDIDLIKAV